MEERRIPEDEACATLEESDAEYPGNHGRTAAERIFPPRRLIIKVLYDRDSEDERVVVTVECGLPVGKRP